MEKLFDDAGDLWKTLIQQKYFSLNCRLPDVEFFLIIIDCLPPFPKGQGKQKHFKKVQAKFQVKNTHKAA